MDGTFIDANQACQEWSGYTLAEAAGRTTTEMGFWQGPGKRTAFIHEMMGKGAVDGLEMEYTNRGGEARDVLHSARLIEINGRQCLLSHIQDISDEQGSEGHEAERGASRGMAIQLPGVVFILCPRQKEMGFIISASGPLTSWD
jgi:PAS domain S-box-containing protein